MCPCGCVASLCVCKRECLFVSIRPCNKIATCPGYHPAFVRWQMGWASIDAPDPDFRKKQLRHLVVKKTAPPHSPPNNLCKKGLYPVYGLSWNEKKRPVLASFLALLLSVWKPFVTSHGVLVTWVGVHTLSRSYENEAKCVPAGFWEAGPPLGCRAPGLWGSPSQSALAPEWPLPCGSSSWSAPPRDPGQAREVWTSRVASFSLRKDRQITVSLKKYSFTDSSVRTKKTFYAVHAFLLKVTFPTVVFLE